MQQFNGFPGSISREELEESGLLSIINGGEVRLTGLEPQPSRLEIDLPLTRASPALDSRRRAT